MAKKTTEKTEETDKMIQVRVTKPLWGKFNLPYTIGHSPEIEAKLAIKIIESGYGIIESEAKKQDELQAKQNEEDSKE